MGRNLVLCLDGTSNLFGRINTNVVKLYEMLDRASPDQFAYYQPGIGTIPPPGMWNRISRWLITRLDLAFALLLEEHVSAAYRFLMRYYRNGDSIFIFGFSRGAYTARVLSGMLHKVGLLSQGNEELVPFAWNTYRRQQDGTEAAEFKATFSRAVGVHFLGLWDTVSSIGWVPWPRHFPFTQTNPEVEIIRHAIALDERRAYFPQNRWGEQQPGQDLVEVWFPGVHCDVGGGYPEAESGLSKIALGWIAAHAETAGLKIDPSAKARILPSKDQLDTAAPRADAKIHESLHGLWWILEVLPKTYKDPAANYARRVMFHLGRPRFVAPGSQIHHSVEDRMRVIARYRPKNLPNPDAAIP